MRDQKRSFVVEYKSRARASKITKPSSIWGDTDLKAVARQVEEESSHLPTAGGISGIEVVPQAPDLDTSRASSALLSTMPIGIAGQVTEPATVTAEIHPHVETSEKTAIADKQPEDISVSPVRKGRRARYGRPAGGNSAEVSAPIEVNPAELADLLNENARLRALLRLRLEADNQCLKAMLARFPS